MNARTPSSSDLQAFVREYYGKLLASSDDLKTNACCASGAPPAWIASRLQHVHEQVLERFYGCGFPIPHGVEGKTVLDLGCGTGRDVYVLAQIAGESGHVHGVDMTDGQLAIARQTETWHADRFGFARPNTTFHRGYVEDLGALGFADHSVDVVVSNCVVNLSPRKDLVMAEIFRVLRPGGEFYFSDVCVDRRLPPEVASDPELYAECLGGAMYRQDFEDLARQTGFLGPRIMKMAPVTIEHPGVQQKVGAARFTAVTYRLFKLEDLEPRCEDYGQTATYRGSLEGARSVFWLDDHHAFERGRPERICGNTAAMLTQTRLAPHFEVTGTRTVHYGEFPCEPTLAARSAGDGPAGPHDCC